MNSVNTNRSTRYSFLRSKGLWIIIVSLIAGLYVYHQVDPHWIEQKTTYEVFENSSGNLAYTARGKEVVIGDIVAYSESALQQGSLDQFGLPQVNGEPLSQQWVSETIVEESAVLKKYSLVQAKLHYGWWSLLPAFVAVALCLITKEPLTSLGGGIVVGAFMLGKFDITGDVLIPSLATDSSASILLLYLWLLGGLLGVWSKTGASQAFATYMTRKFVRGPRSAKFVAWLLGIIFFQGGTVSTVLVGTTVKPLADRENISHEEMSYIVDSTASPIAILLAFNAWPLYVQALIFVPGVAFLATESDRLAFFFSSVPLSFYAIFAVLGTLFLSLDYTRFSGSGLRNALNRARTSGELDAPGAKPLSAKELQVNQVPDTYSPHVAEFFIPLGLIIGIAVGTFIAGGVPKVNWAFGTALLVSAFIAFVRGMDLPTLLDGIGNGLKGVVLASVILMLAIAVGAISKEVGGGLFLVELLGEELPFWALPICLQLITMLTAFSTGTSWGTYAIAFPLAMPLAWAVAQSQGLANPELFMAICFATVLNGSVYGDQCSPISDTTVISSMTTGCDLVDHVKTQIVPATYAATAAAICWTAMAFFMV
jgi:Na+/H+ antiporter NhaC